VLAVDHLHANRGRSRRQDRGGAWRGATDPNAFIRPSPAAGTLGGVAAKTRETMLICEAAAKPGGGGGGGEGTSPGREAAASASRNRVSDMNGRLLVLMLPCGGDELQGTKKGVVEIADMIAVNRPTEDNVKRARRRTENIEGRCKLLHPALAPTGRRRSSPIRRWTGTGFARAVGLRCGG